MNRMRSAAVVHVSHNGCGADQGAIIVTTAFAADGVRVTFLGRGISRMKRREIAEAAEEICRVTEGELTDAANEIVRRGIIKRHRSEIAKMVAKLIVGYGIYTWNERRVTFMRWRNDEERLGERVENITHRAMLSRGEVGRFGVIGAYRRRMRG